MNQLVIEFGQMKDDDIKRFVSELSEIDYNRIRRIFNEGRNNKREEWSK